MAHESSSNSRQLYAEIRVQLHDAVPRHVGLLYILSVFRFNDLSHNKRIPSSHCNGVDCYSSRWVRCSVLAFHGSLTYSTIAASNMSVSPSYRQFFSSLVRAGSWADTASAQVSNTRKVCGSFSDTSRYSTIHWPLVSLVYAEKAQMDASKDAHLFNCAQRMYLVIGCCYRR